MQRKQTPLIRTAWCRRHQNFLQIWTWSVGNVQDYVGDPRARRVCVIRLDSESGAQRVGILVTALLQSDFDSLWFAQRRLACAVENRLWCGALDAADTNLDARNNDCIRG